MTRVRGRFTDFTGTVQFDEARPELSSASFEAGTGSIDTGTADRDQHLRSEDFFFVEKFPTLTFVLKPAAERDMSLTKRQREILTYLAAGTGRAAASRGWVSRWSSTHQGAIPSAEDRPWRL